MPVSNDAEESFESGQAPDVKEDYRPEITKQVIGMLQEEHSICITGEVGIGKTHLARLIAKNFKDKCCYGNYQGDNTKCLQQIATSLDVPIEVEGKFLTAKQLKEEIAVNLGKDILICDHFHKWPASLKGWVEDLHSEGAVIVLLGSHRDLEGVAYKIPRLVLSPLKDKEIRNIVLAKSYSLALSLTTTQVSEIASRAGGNPMLAERMVQELKQGVESTNVQDGNNYRSITPFLMFTAGLIGAVRFVGMATGDMRLRIVGGVFITILFSLRYLSALFPKASRK